MPIVSIAQRNDAPSEYDARHDVYEFSLDTDDPLRPFLFGQSIGGGHGDRGGCFRLGVHELPDSAEDWRAHLRTAGCGWVIAYLESVARTAKTENDLVAANARAVRDVLDARALNRLFLQRSSFEPDPERTPFYEGAQIGDAKIGIQCDDCDCEGWVRVQVARLIDESPAWLRSLSDLERASMFRAFACRTEVEPGRHGRPISHDGGYPSFGLSRCELCAQAYAVYLTCEELQPARYRMRLQGFSRVVPGMEDAPQVPASLPAPSRSTVSSEPSSPVAAAPDAARQEPSMPTPPKKFKAEKPKPGWFSAPDEPPVYYVSAADKPGAIAKDIATLYAAMEARRDSDRAEKGDALYFHSDGTQSKLRLYWVDRSQGEPVGEWVYTLVLRDGEFEDAHTFEITCRRAVGLFVRKQLPQTIKAYFRREFDRFGVRVFPFSTTSRKKR